MSRTLITLTVNGQEREASVWPHQTLLHVLRDVVGATEVKYGCGEGVCSTCTVLVDGESVNSCLMFAVQADGRSVTTVMGLSDDVALHPLQESFLEHDAAQCGYCTPGMLLIAYEFLASHPRPSREQIREALAGNLCRCTGYTKIIDAVEAFAVGEGSVGSRTAPAPQE